MQHWHVEDHYTGDSKLYPEAKYRNMRQWVYRHGGTEVVAVELCDDARCLTIEDGVQAGGGE